MLGNVFSPRYFSARRALGGQANPLEYCCFHVATHGRHARFALQETSAVARSADRLTVGTSSLQLHGDVLEAQIDERCAPLPRRLRGRVRMQLPSLLDHEVQLTRDGAHRWTPLAPVARAVVELEQPALRFEGHAYLDANEGDAGLETGFSQWSWSRLTTDDGRSIMSYDCREVDGHESQRLFVASASGIEHEDPARLHAAPMPRSWFGLRPSVRVDSASLGRVDYMADTPFYTRACVSAKALGRPVVGVHEWLDLQRFGHPLVQRMLPYRMRHGFPRSGDPR